VSDLGGKKMCKSNKCFGNQFPIGEGILITGCSSGIGRSTAIYLAQKGFTVFAGVRKEQDADNLHKLNEANLIPVCPLDLTRAEHVTHAFEYISNELKKRNKVGLYAIINIAGGGFISPIELIDLDKFKTEVEARIIGPIRLLQAFLPMIRASRGRILWIVTPALLPTPFVSSIHICDFAVNCLIRTLKIELKKWDIPQIMIRCGGIKTEGVEKSYKQLEESFKHWPQEGITLYADILGKEVERLKQFDKNRTEPIEVAKTVYRALCDRKPRSRYRVGYMSGLAAMLEYLPQTFVDYIIAKRVEK
jgi:NAD(P)-dependent dehydrogenase (short-subunit alcohol dehydrogenase family)